MAPATTLIRAPAAAIDMLVQLLTQAVTGPHELECLLEAAISIRCVHETSVIDGEQCLAILRALQSLERATCFDVPQGCTMVRLQAGIRALGGLVRFWAEPPERRGIWDERVVLEWTRYAKVFANDIDSYVICQAMLASTAAFVESQAGSAVHLPHTASTVVH